MTCIGGKHVAGLTLCLLGAAAAHATSPPMVFEHLTVQDGLSQSTVMDVLQDSQGFVWLATESGLNRFDGYDIRRYHHRRGDPTGLVSDYIWDIEEDANGDLWLATEGGGVARWNRDSDTFSSFLHDPDDPESLSSNLTRVLLVETGRVWIGTRGGGVNLLEPATGKVTRFRHNPDVDSSLSSDVVFGIQPADYGRVWVATDAGLNLLDPASGESAVFRHDADDPYSLSDDAVIALFADRSGTIWTGTFEGGLSRLDSTTGRFEHFRHDPEDPTSLSHDHVRAIHQDDRGRLWIGTEDGLNMLQARSRQSPSILFTRYHKDRSDPRSLPDSYVMSLYQDRGGMLWVGTRAGGVSRWNPRSWSLGHYAGTWLNDAHVTAFADTGKGQVWVGTLGAGLARVHLAPGHVEPFQDVPSVKGALSDDRVMSLLLARDGVLWIGTMAGGLNRLDPVTGEVQVFRFEPDDPQSISADGIMALHEDPAGDIWIGTFGGGLSRFDKGSGRFQRFPHGAGIPGALSGSRATAVAQDQDGALWIATDVGGLNLLYPATGAIRHFRHDPDDPTSLSSDAIYALHVDRSGTLWVGTADGGLDRLVGSSRNPDRIGFDNLTQADGLASNVIYGVQSDAAGFLWLSTSNGLTRVEPLTREIKNLHRNHGLQGEEFNFGAHYRAPDGRLYFGGNNGFNVFHPAMIEQSTQAPPVVLTSFEKLNRPAPTALPYPLVQVLQLDYTDDVVTFEFAALDFTAPDKNRYAYRLEGFDQDWVYAGKVRRVTYTNLKAGAYAFRVKAANSDGVWNEEGLSIPITVAAAPWETKWAYLSYCLAAILLIGLAFRWQQRKLRHEEQYARRLEREVHDRTTELEERNEQLEQLSHAKSDFLARMSHEIRTPMNGVLGMTELLMADELTGEQQGLVRTIHDSGAALLGVINDILDFSRIEAGGLRLEAIEFDVVDLVEDIARLLANQTREKGVKLEVSTPPDLFRTLIGDPLRLRQVLINLLGNAIKFTSEGVVRVAVSSIGESAEQVALRFEVEDTGAGIKPESLEHIFDSFSQEDESTTRRYGGTGLGLSISNELVELMGGQITVQSTPGIGSTFGFTLSFQKGAARELALPASSTSQQESPPPFHGRVLLVEDNPVNQSVAQGMLWQLGCEVDAVTNGRSAVKRLLTESFDVVLMDCEMPEMDGFEATALIRQGPEASRDLPILAVTANAVEGDRERCLAAGMNEYLSKPFTLDSLRAALEPWLPLAAVTPEVAPEVAKSTVPAAASDATEPLVDRGTLDTLRSLQSADQPDFLERVLSAYFEDSAALLQRLRGAFDAGNSEELRRAAHALKSTSQAVGAARLADYCRELEACGRQGHLARARGPLGRLSKSYPAVITALRRELDKVA